MKNNKISLGRNGGKKYTAPNFYRRNNRKKNRKCHIGSDKKGTNFGLKLFNGPLKFPYKLKELISLILPYVELINNNDNKGYLKNFQNGLQVLTGVSFQNH